MFWELSRKMMDGWTSLIYNPRATDIPKAAVALHNRKITDNSSEAHPCLFLCPTCLKRSCLSVVAHMSCRIGSKRLRSPSQVQHTERCVCVSVGGWAVDNVHGCVFTARFSYNFKSSFSRA